MQEQLPQEPLLFGLDLKMRPIFTIRRWPVIPPGKNIGWYWTLEIMSTIKDILHRQIYLMSQLLQHHLVILKECQIFILIILIVQVLPQDFLATVIHMEMVLEELMNQLFPTPSGLTHSSLSECLTNRPLLLLSRILQVQPLLCLEEKSPTERQQPIIQNIIHKGMAQGQGSMVLYLMSLLLGFLTESHTAIFGSIRPTTIKSLGIIRATFRQSRHPRPFIGRPRHQPLVGTPQKIQGLSSRTRMSLTMQPTFQIYLQILMSREL